MADLNRDELKEIFGKTGYKEAVGRLSAAAAEDAAVSGFLEELAGRVSPAADERVLGGLFTQLAEEHICGGRAMDPASDLVRVVPTVRFLCYYSRKYIYLETAPPARVLAEVETIRAALRVVDQTDPEQRSIVFDGLLGLSGRLRRKGYPLWLTTEDEVTGCRLYKDYRVKLALADDDAPALRFRIGRGHVGVTPNVPAGEPDHDGSQTMSVHYTTAVDGMYYAAFVPGGATAGGAVEYVSKLDNTAAVDLLEMIDET